MSDAQLNIRHILAFLEGDGWTFSHSNNQYYFYSPPDKFKFPKNFHFPLVNPDLEGQEFYDRVLEDTLNAVSEIYGTDINKLLFNIDSYTSLLRSNALFFKLESTEVVFDRTLNIHDIWNFLRNLSFSFSAYLKTTFQMDYFGIDIDEKNTKNFNTQLGHLSKFSKLRLIDLQYQSFSFGVSVDTVMGNDKMNLDGIHNWRKALIPNFDKDVASLPFNSKDSIEKVVSKFDEESRRAIYSPVIKSINNRNFNVFKTNSQYEKRKKLTRPDDVSTSILVPHKSIEDKKREIELYQIVVPIDKSKSSITFKTNSFENDLFSQKSDIINWSVEKINFGGEEIEFKIPLSISITVVPETSEFNVTFEPLQIDFEVEEFNEISKNLSSQIMGKYLTFIDIQEKVRLKMTLSSEEQEIFDFFNSTLTDSN